MKNTLFALIGLILLISALVLTIERDARYLLLIIPAIISLMIADRRL